MQHGLGLLVHGNLWQVGSNLFAHLVHPSFVPESFSSSLEICRAGFCCNRKPLRSGACDSAVSCGYSAYAPQIPRHHTQLFSALSPGSLGADFWSLWTHPGLDAFALFAALYFGSLFHRCSLHSPGQHGSKGTWYSWHWWLFVGV